MAGVWEWQQGPPEELQRAWFLYANPEVREMRAPLAIYFGGHDEDVTHFLKQVHAHGCTRHQHWLFVDYPGYGFSEGRTEFGVLVPSAQLWFDGACTMPIVDSSRVSCIGRGLGSAVAVELAARRPVERLVLTSAFESLASVGAWHYPWAATYFSAFDVARIAPSLTQPMLMLRAAHDELIPAENTRNLYFAWGGQKYSHVFENATYENVLLHPEYLHRVFEFLERRLPTPPTHLA